MKAIKTWKDLMNITASDLANATDEELTALYRRISNPTIKGNPMSSPMDMAMEDCYTKEQNEAIKALYWAITAEQDERYRTANEPKIREYFNKYFKGKTWEQISAEQKALEEAYEAGKRGDELPDVGDWSWYSDWHKDTFGYRPHGIVCGEYIRPW